MSLSNFTKLAQASVGGELDLTALFTIAANLTRTECGDTGSDRYLVMAVFNNHLDHLCAMTLKVIDIVTEAQEKEEAEAREQRTRGIKENE